MGLAKGVVSLFRVGIGWYNNPQLVIRDYGRLVFSETMKSEKGYKSRTKDRLGVMLSG